MQSNRDIYRAANVLVRKHGSDARNVAAKRAQELLDQGDLDDAATWRKIIKAVEVLQNTEYPTSSRVH
ncbi:MAG TPA: hypothetical protein VM325_17835 [Alphaproteobacteria bacterium]|nr:hypothetical protein [Alphaproteobacteria bacterium]